MKSLYIIRHAKSSWDNPLLSDFDRPLNSRGKKDAPQMGKALKEKCAEPDKWLSSPAKRALQTAVSMAQTMEINKPEIQTDQRLYHASAKALISILKEQGAEVASLFLFGHNPGLTDLANMLSSAWIDNIPTCGIFAVSFSVAHWHEIEGKHATFLFFDYPKRYA